VAIIGTATPHHRPLFPSPLLAGAKQQQDEILRRRCRPTSRAATNTLPPPPSCTGCSDGPELLHLVSQKGCYLVPSGCVVVVMLPIGAPAGDRVAGMLLRTGAPASVRVAEMLLLPPASTTACCTTGAPSKGPISYPSSTCLFVYGH
jgi:hypothetical protein